ncbi:PREDICTED: casein kinase II subunit beta-1-like [Camelina sativa]|uniref:Casein kinase II subunit beta n=1 Tax=Camelina sativa TaxID=90675 RepID=A0ABM1QHX2_CAMSA|nr:PREDICTED: casein kinase II subunit beta-1-like [Camelina sativa]
MNFFCGNIDESDTDSEESYVSGSDTLFDDDYIHDDFNLCGFSSLVPYLDVESSHGEMFIEEQNELIESAAEMLYGLIRARYILTSKQQRVGCYGN